MKKVLIFVLLLMLFLSACATAPAAAAEPQSCPNLQIEAQTELELLNSERATYKAHYALMLGEIVEIRSRFGLNGDILQAFLPKEITTPNPEISNQCGELSGVINAIKIVKEEYRVGISEVFQVKVKLDELHTREALSYKEVKEAVDSALR